MRLRPNEELKLAASPSSLVEYSQSAAALRRRVSQTRQGGSEVRAFLVRRVFVTVALSMALSAQSATAQRVARSAMVRATPASPSVISFSRGAQKPRARSYVFTGAVLGMVGMAAGLAIYAENHNDDSLTPLGAYVPAVLAGGVVGGTIGFVAYRVRY